MIHLDHAATTPVLPEVLDAMAPWWRVPANPSSAHRSGQAAAAAVERARAQVAALFAADPAGVVFTSGATEANHLALRGALRRHPGRLVLSALEHPSVQGAADALAEAGVPVERLGTGADGVARLPDALPAGTSALALMAAQHETGVLQPLEAARALADAAGAWLHVDATQAAGRVRLPVVPDGLALSGHKLGGPPGVGALVLRDGRPFPALFPGTQERGRRGGTVPTALVVGLGVACAAATAALDARAAHHRALVTRLEAALLALGARVIGAGAPRVPGTTCVVFPGLRGEALVQALDLRGVAVSSGAACASGSHEPSPALLAVGDPEPHGALRISLGPPSSAADVDALLAALPQVLVSLRLEADLVG